MYTKAVFILAGDEYRMSIPCIPRIGDAVTLPVPMDDRRGGSYGVVAVYHKYGYSDHHVEIMLSLDDPPGLKEWLKMGSTLLSEAVPPPEAASPQSGPDDPGT